MGRIQPTPLGLFSHVNPPQDAVGDMDAESLQKLQVPVSDHGDVPDFCWR